MTITVALDACTYRGTVALLDDNRLVGEGLATMRGRDAEHLMPTVAAVIREAGIATSDIGRVVCGAGPGSFTSLRIAASIAKGLAVGRHLPLYPVSSLALVVAANLDGVGTGERYLAVLDALRGDCYAAEFEHAGTSVKSVSGVELIPTANLTARAARTGAALVGPDQEGNWWPHAKGLVRLGDQVDREGPVDLAGWEPSYGRQAEAQAKWEAAHGKALSH